MSGTKCGGLSTPKEATPEIQEYCDAVRLDAEKEAQKTFGLYEAHSYTSQVVAGTNYFVKVKVGTDEHIHLRVHKSLPHAGSEIKLHGFQGCKAKDDPITYF